MTTTPGPGTVAEGVLANERDNLAVARAFALAKTYDLYTATTCWTRYRRSSCACG